MLTKEALPDTAQKPETVKCDQLQGHFWALNRIENRLTWLAIATIHKDCHWPNLLEVEVKILFLFK